MAELGYHRGDEDYPTAPIISAAHEQFGLYMLVLVRVVASVIVVIVALALGAVETRALLLPYLLPIALLKPYFERDRETPEPVASQTLFVVSRGYSIGSQPLSR